MIRSFLSFLGLGDKSSWNNKKDVRRRYARHQGFHAEVMMDGRAYSIRDWSMGGVAFEAPSDQVYAGEEVQVTLKFHFVHETISIQQQARIVRTEKRRIAAAFSPLAPTMRRKFEQVLDSMHAQSFLKSQIA